MRRFALVVAVVGAVAALGFAAPAGADDDLAAKLMGMEKTLWTAWAAADGAPFEAHLMDDALNVTPGGVTVGKAAMLEDITSGACEVRSWEVGEPTLHRVTDDVVMLSYDATQDATCEGHVIPAKTHVVTTWVNHDGTWKNWGYFETPAMAAE